MSEHIKIGVYSFFDLKSNTYDTPFCCESDLFASRHFIMMQKKQGTLIGFFPEDFYLVRIGWFDKNDGKLEVDEEVITIGKKKEDE